MTISLIARASFALCVVMFGCSVAPDDSDDAIVASAHAALSTSPKGIYPLAARASFDAVTHTATIDVTTTNFQQVPSDPDPHNSDEFLVVMIYVDGPGGRDLVRVLTRDGVHKIGPGGGCIHFSIPANLGDRLFIGGVVRLDGSARAQVAAAPIVTI